MVFSPSILHDFLDNFMPSDEAIMQSMVIEDRPWENMHHHWSFLHDQEMVENILITLVFFRLCQSILGSHYVHFLPFKREIRKHVKDHFDLHLN